MGFFNRNKGPLIPPVAPTGGQQAAAASDPYARRGGPANGGGPSGDRFTTSSSSDPYAGVEKARARGNDPDNPYAMNASQKNAPPGYDDNDAARNELFGGLTDADVKKPAQRKYGYEGREFEEDYDEDEEVEGIKTELRATKMDSLASTRNTLRMAREAEENARGTMARLGDQSESLANSERHLDVAKANTQRAEDKAGELKQLNRSIFRPVIVWNKDAKRAAAEQKALERHTMEREDRLNALKDVQTTRQQLGQAARGGQGGGGLQPNAQRNRAEARKRYQFDATASDDELEDELDENLDETLEISRRLKTLATGMGAEVDRQNKRIGRITDKTDNLDIKVQLNTDRLKAIK